MQEDMNSKIIHIRNKKKQNQLLDEVIAEEINIVYSKVLGREKCNQVRGYDIGVIITASLWQLVDLMWVHARLEDGLNLRERTQRKAREYRTLVRDEVLGNTVSPLIGVWMKYSIRRRRHDFAEPH
ncbi:unnamed protein product [Prunus armeniaca]|uniref:Uncharacterized protein n=1 Tax=Prunus armeniaca TaxID=36596 RepID=A0A6J5X0L9_PRUAR|nr:unnamed protein product [Prunus armeniaca]